MNRSEDLLDIIKEFEDLVRSQDRNAADDPYNMGLANGLRLGSAIVKDTAPKYHKTPKRWKGDLSYLNLNDICGDTRSGSLMKGMIGGVIGSRFGVKL